jgi:hypothetical protein
MATEIEKKLFLELTQKNYFDQARWYLNSFWKLEGEAEKENIWNIAHKFVELDTRKGN